MIPFLRSTAWRGLIAVASKRVYLAPADPFGWIDDPPGINRIIGLYWLTALFYPDQYQEDLRTNAREFYDKFYRIKLTDRQLEALVRPAEARAGESRRHRRAAAGRRAGAVPQCGAECAAAERPASRTRRPCVAGAAEPAGYPRQPAIRPGEPRYDSVARTKQTIPRCGVQHTTARPVGLSVRCRDLVGRHREPGFADQRLVMVAFDAVLGGAAVRYRAAGDAGTGLDEAAEPRREGGIGIWRRVCHRPCRRATSPRQEKRPHHSRRRLSEEAHAIS